MTKPAWETVLTGADNTIGSVDRLPVPGGWIYEFQDRGVGERRRVYVPDPAVWTKFLAGARGDR